ncbi:MAG: hypothetical protein D3915_14175 [Candidatus Electrothrix sp. AU1_5]|nr:hypothetical protein [Candidatus Electrothrix gigas]
MVVPPFCTPVFYLVATEVNSAAGGHTIKYTAVLKSCTLFSGAEHAGMKMMHTGIDVIPIDFDPIPIDFALILIGIGSMSTGIGLMSIDIGPFSIEIVLITV